MDKTPPRKTLDGCACLIKFFILFVGFVIFVRAIVIPSWENWDNHQDRRRDAFLMASLAAAINHERKFNSEETLQNLFQKAQRDLEASWRKDSAQAATIEWDKFELQEVPLTKQETPRRLDYVLINKSSRLMMLSDGRLTYVFSDLESVAKNYPYIDNPQRNLW